jgi:hypothetical protein
LLCPLRWYSLTQYSSSLPQSTWWVLKSWIFSECLCRFMLKSYGAHSLWQEEHLLSEKTTHLLIKSRAIRAVCVAITLIMAVAVPNFGVFSGFVGALLTPVCFYLPISISKL